MSEPKVSDYFRRIVFATLPLLLENDPVPEHNSKLTGALRYKEVMESESEARFFEEARMGKESFLKLVDFMSTTGGLNDGIFSIICVGEKLMIFMKVLTGMTVRNIANHWQHSTSTIDLIIHEVAEAFIRNEAYFIRIPKPDDGVHKSIAEDPKL